PSTRAFAWVCKDVANPIRTWYYGKQWSILWRGERPGTPFLHSWPGEIGTHRGTYGEATCARAREGLTSDATTEHAEGNLVWGVLARRLLAPRRAQLRPVRRVSAYAPADLHAQALLLRARAVAAEGAGAGREPVQPAPRPGEAARAGGVQAAVPGLALQ